MIKILQNILNILFYIIAAFYVFMMCDLLFRFSYLLDTDRIITRSYNLIPFETIRLFANGGDFSLSYVMNNILGNIVVFIPFGLYLQVILKNKAFVKSLLIVLLTSIAVELVQYAFGLGAGDIDDVLLNTLGGLLGIVIYRIFRTLLKGESRTKTAIAVLSLLFGAPVIFLYFTTVAGHLRL